MDGPMCTTIQSLQHVCTCPTSGDGGKKSIFAGSIDTGAEKKTANNISDLAIKQIDQFEDKYKYKLQSDSCSLGDAAVQIWFLRFLKTQYYNHTKL
ncbi:hypothetical protein Avbf_18692 [Armadillidium vulgare]|nr:hypothetical protein Avbf_18692 [Armadillidium vulgare]